MPDGTLFDLPLTDSLPSPISVSSNFVGETIYLCLPIITNGEGEITYSSNRSESMDFRCEIVLLK